MKNNYLWVLFVIGSAVMISCNKETSKPEEKEREISVSDLPIVVKDHINRTYLSCSMNEADEVIHPGGNITYDVELNYQGKTIEVMYDAQGNFLGEENENEEEDDDSGKKTEKED